MMLQISVACDGDWNEPEVQISGSIKALSDFGGFLNETQGRTNYEIPPKKNKYYPESVTALVIDNSQSGGDRITVKLDENKLSLIGTSVALNRLGDSLINFFNAEASLNEHFQLDYYEGNDILNETTCHLIFLCE